MPGVKRRARQEQQTKAILQAAHSSEAWAQTRTCARVHGSVGTGLEADRSSVPTPPAAPLAMPSGAAVGSNLTPGPASYSLWRKKPSATSTASPHVLQSISTPPSALMAPSTPPFRGRRGTKPNELHVQFKSRAKFNTKLARFYENTPTGTPSSRRSSAPSAPDLTRTLSPCSLATGFARPSGHREAILSSASLDPHLRSSFFFFFLKGGIFVLLVQHTLGQGRDLYGLCGRTALK